MSIFGKILFEYQHDALVLMPTGSIMNSSVAFNEERHVFSPLESFVIWIDGKIKIINAGITSKSSRPKKPGG